MTPLWDWLAALPPAVLLQRSSTAYLLVNAAHILSIGLLVGAIACLDLRLLGAFGRVPLAPLAPYLSRMAACGLAMAAATGLWLFCVNPHDYAGNTALLAKLGIVALGVANALWLHRRHAWRHLPDEGTPETALRLHAAVSLACWTGAVVAGRWIGFL